MRRFQRVCRLTGRCTQLADRYRSFNLGIGKDMGALGALSMDVTQANATLPDDSEHRGQSVRFLYNKALSDGHQYPTSRLPLLHTRLFQLADTTYNRMSGYNVETQDGVIQIKPTFTDYYNLAYNKRGKVQSASPSN